jgi:YbgC/YbaW family acyl-CoA thioester hydrolase
MFTVKRQINFYECDPAGIIFYSRVFDFCHSAYEQLIMSFQLDQDYWNNPNYVVPIIHSHCDYIKPLKYGDEILIEVSVSILKQSSFELTYKIKLKDEIYALVKTVHVFVSKGDWNKREIPSDIMKALRENFSEE